MMQSIKEAARSGNAPALNLLGLCYADGYGQGKGVPQDDTEATRWLTLSAAQGYAPARFMLESCHEP